jgi:hypothetical protein
MLTEEEVNQAVALRMTRQEIFNRDNPPRVWAIIDESALLRWAGSDQIMRELYAHLIGMSQHPNVVIQAITNQDGFSCAGGHPFTLLSSPYQNDMVYVEDTISARYIREREGVKKYDLTFDYLRAMALSDEKTMEFLQELSRGSGTT